MRSRSELKRLQHSHINNQIELKAFLKKNNNELRKCNQQKKFNYDFKFKKKLSLEFHGITAVLPILRPPTLEKYRPEVQPW